MDDGGSTPDSRARASNRASRQRGPPKRRMRSMDRYRTGVFAVVLGLALVGGATSVYARSNEYAGEEIGTIRHLNRTQNLVVLSSGTEFHTTDQRMLDGLREGEVVKVDFSFNGDRAILNSIEPANLGDSPGASPTTEPGPHEH